MNRREFILTVPAVAAVAGLVQPAPPDVSYTTIGDTTYIDSRDPLTYDEFWRITRPYYEQPSKKYYLTAPNIYPLTTPGRPR